MTSRASWFRANYSASAFKSGGQSGAHERNGGGRFLLWPAAAAWTPGDRFTPTQTYSHARRALLCCISCFYSSRARPCAACLTRRTSFLTARWLASDRARCSATRLLAGGALPRALASAAARAIRRARSSSPASMRSWPRRASRPARARTRCAPPSARRTTAANAPLRSGSLAAPTVSCRERRASRTQVCCFRRSAQHICTKRHRPPTIFL